MTMLVPRCSGLILTGKKTLDGHPKIARNYEFTIEDEDLKLCRTAPAGKYAHIAGTIVEFGRCEGINEKGWRYPCPPAASRSATCPACVRRR